MRAGLHALMNRRKHVVAALLTAVLIAWLVLAGSAIAQPLLDFTPEERAQIVGHGPWPPAPRQDASNRVIGHPAAIDLGKRLFFDKRLSIDGRFSCASCHRANQAFQDGLPTAIGRNPGTRNTPSLLDVAGQRWFGWDGANDSLWAASLAPVMALNEMAQNPKRLAALARARPAWRTAYRSVWGKPMPTDDIELSVNLAKALAAYQATLVSPRTRFDDFRDAIQRGDDYAASRYPVDAQRGLRLFMGEARCSVCHAGAGFTNGEFGDIGVSFFVPGGVDPGRHGGLVKLKANAMNRLGAHNDAGAVDPDAVLTQHLLIEHRHFGEFRVPGLRQLVRTAPYMHNGSLATIEDVVRHYDKLNEERLHADGERILRPLNLSTQQAADLAAFLRSLSD